MHLPRHSLFTIRACTSGSVLLAVLCLVAMLCFIVLMAFSQHMQAGETQARRSGRLRARQLAEMGVAVASHPRLMDGDPLLHRQLSSIEEFHALLTTEESRININQLLTTEHLPLLESMLTSWGLSLADAQSAAAALLDWCDADDAKRRPDSAEKADYEHDGLPGRPFNQPFTRIEDLALVRHFELIAQAKPDWRSLFTVMGSGQLDINTASAAVISSLTGASAASADRLVAVRAGPDGAPHTPDDTPWQSLPEALSTLGLSGPQAAAISQLLTLRGPTRRIECIGRAGDEFCGISVLIQATRGSHQLAAWSEFPARSLQPF